MRDFSPAIEKIKLRFPKRNIEVAYALCRQSSRGKEEKCANARMRECVSWVSACVGGFDWVDKYGHAGACPPVIVGTYSAALLAAQRKGGAKRPHRGKMRERRVTGVYRETSQARNAGRCLWAGLMYSSPGQRRLIRVRSPMAPQDTPERGATASRPRRPKRLSGDPAGVPKHPPFGNGGGFADARLGAGYVSAPAAIQTQSPPRFPDGARCVPAGSPMRSKAKGQKSKRLTLKFIDLPWSRRTR